MPKGQKYRTYDSALTADINRKGVLDIDVVKGCTAGILAHGPRGCYQACYAATGARFRGIDFSRSVVRRVHNKAQAEAIKATVKRFAGGFFRIGTMGDPCHSWEHTVQTVEWLAPYAVPIIVTKHWQRASDEHLERMKSSGAIVNTSISALDGAIHLAYRLAEIQRYADAGILSVARVVSCCFDLSNGIGFRLDKLQRELLSLRPVIDNPLRANSTHPLVTAGVILLRKVYDLNSARLVSIAPDSTTYLGHCSNCTDLCGMGLSDVPDVRPDEPQLPLNF